MATAFKKTIPPVVPKFNVVLELSMDEAETLCGITQRIGGPYEGTHRTHCISIGRALRDAGVTRGFSEEDTEPGNRAIYFLAEKK